MEIIDNTIYERASVDGASGVQQFFHLTLPGLSPIMFYTLVVNIIQAFQSFGQIKILTEGGPNETTNVIVYSIYRDAFFNYRFGSAAAQSVILFFIVMLITLVMFRIEKKRRKTMINTKALRKRRIHTGIRVLINIVTAIIVLIPLLYAVSIAFMPSGELFTMDMNLFPKNPTIENFKQAFTSVPLLRFIINSFVMAACITLGQIVTCSLAAFAFSFLEF